MKGLLVSIILSVFAILSIPIDIEAQSSKGGPCPDGMTTKVVGVDIICVNPGTGEETRISGSTNEVQLTDEQYVYLGIGVIVVIIILAAIAKSSQSSSEPESYKDVERKSFSHSTKERVKDLQKGKCADCGKYPTHWEFDHIHGRGDNSIENCQGLCRDCHQTKTLEDDH